MSATAKDTPAKRVIWRGVITKGNEANVITGFLVDQWGWHIHIRGVYNPKERQYDLEGVVGDVPDSLRLPVIDDLEEVVQEGTPDAVSSPAEAVGDQE